MPTKSEGACTTWQKITTLVVTSRPQYKVPKQWLYPGYIKTIFYTGELRQVPSGNSPESCICDVLLRFSQKIRSPHRNRFHPLMKLFRNQHLNLYILDPQSDAVSIRNAKINGIRWKNYDTVTIPTAAPYPEKDRITTHQRRISEHQFWETT